jgi:REP element-mobilizing transposase RayT
VLSALTAGQQQKLFGLRAYVLMANHVHILIGPLAPLAQITQQIKGATAREANLILGRTGSRFWQGESFDHWIRDAGEWLKVRS